MRVNVYSQELTDEIKIIVKRKITDGKETKFEAVQMILQSSPLLHDTPEDDDRSAVTFWLPKSEARRMQLADTFAKMSEAVTNIIAGDFDDIIKQNDKQSDTLEIGNDSK